MKISILTGGHDESYALPLLTALVARGICVDFIGNDYMQRADVVGTQKVNYLNLHGDQNPLVPIKEKIVRVLKYYIKLLWYAVNTDSQLFHILWLYKFVYFERRTSFLL